MPHPTKINKRMTPGQACDAIHNSIGKIVSLETFDGSVRQGRFSGMRSKSIMVNGHTVDWPTGVELNGDAGDVISFELIQTLVIE